MTRANQANESETELARSQQINHVLQISLWLADEFLPQYQIQMSKFSRKYFPSPDISYYIKTQSGSQNGQFLHMWYANVHYNRNDNIPHYLHTTENVWSADKFKITKYSDDTFSIFSTVRLGISHLKTFFTHHREEARV
jgi:hypothetical protein